MSENPYAQPYPQTPAPPPVPGKAKPRTWLWMLGIVAAFIVGIGVGGATSTGVDPATTETSSPPTPPATADTVEKPEPEPDNPAADIEDGFCDLLLFTAGDQSEFAASADVVNVGNIGVKVKVTAEFDQLGQDDYVLTKTVKVKVGETKTVNLSEMVDTSTVGRHQEGGYECRVDGKIVDTFGGKQ